MLGVERSASPAELKRAWRDLARLNHPDRNPDDPGAAERIASINAAYSVLSDPERRARYDRYGEDAASAFFDPSLVEPTPPTSRTPPVPRPIEQGEDRTCELELDAQTASSGGGVSVTVREPRACPTCDGTGWRRAGRACSKCEGGRLPGIGPFRIAVPAGLLSGQVLRGVGYGAAGRGKGAPPGDLLITVRVPPSFRVEGQDLITDVPCPADLLQEGGTLEAPLPRGSVVKLRIRPGTESGQKLRVRGGGPAGRDLLVRLVLLPELPVEVPVAGVSLG